LPLSFFFFLQSHHLIVVFSPPFYYTSVPSGRLSGMTCFFCSPTGILVTFFSLLLGVSLPPPRIIYVTSRLPRLGVILFSAVALFFRRSFRLLFRGLLSFLHLPFIPMTFFSPSINRSSCLLPRPHYSSLARFFCLSNFLDDPFREVSLFSCCFLSLPQMPPSRLAFFTSCALSGPGVRSSSPRCFSFGLADGDGAFFPNPLILFFL